METIPEMAAGGSEPLRSMNRHALVRIEIEIIGELARRDSAKLV
jgi:hypothetical protein